jgi:NEDD8-activating enzyme E1
VGKSKAEVAAKRVMERVSGVNIVPHFGRIEDKELDFYGNFDIIVLGLDSIEARSYINSVVCGFLGNFSSFSVDITDPSMRNIYAG